MLRCASILSPAHGVLNSCPLLSFDYLFSVVGHKIVIRYFALITVLMLTAANCKLYTSRVDTITWQFFYALIVRSTDHYRVSFKPEAKIAKLRQIKFQQMYSKNRKILLCRILLFPKSWVHKLSMLEAKYAIWCSMEHLNKEKMFRTKLPIYFISNLIYQMN